MNYIIPTKTLPLVIDTATNPGGPGALAPTVLVTGDVLVTGEPPLAQRAEPAKPAGLVYVVENDRISSVITELIAKKSLSGGEVQCYVNGQRAFDQLIATRRDGGALPDLILLDLDMPLMDGWEFLDALATLTPAVSACVFVLTSSIHPDDLARASGYAAVEGFFTKPLNEASLQRMQQLLRARAGA